MTWIYEVPDGPKMLRETLCVAQARIGNSPFDEDRKAEHVARLQRLIDECDWNRPLGSDGKHGNRHTGTCGCDDALPAPAHRSAEEEAYERSEARLAKAWWFAVGGVAGCVLTGVVGLVVSAVVR